LTYALVDDVGLGEVAQGAGELQAEVAEHHLSASVVAARRSGLMTPAMV